MMPFPYPVNRVYSDAWQTVYANQNAKNWDPGTPYGISRVQVSEDGSMTASQIRDFLADYTRYTNPFAYSNNLAYRLDYYKATEAARISAGKNRASTAYSSVSYTHLTLPTTSLV